MVPREYMTSGESGASQGFLFKEDGEKVFRTAEIYQITEEGEVYLNPGDFGQNTVLAHPETGESFMLKEKNL